MKLQKGDDTPKGKKKKKKKKRHITKGGKGHKKQETVSSVGTIGSPALTMSISHAASHSKEEDSSGTDGILSHTNNICFVCFFV